MSAYILPLFIVGVLIAGFAGRVPVYGSFVSGVKQALQLLLSVMPYFCAVLIAVELFTASGLAEKTQTALAPLLNALGIPPELAQLVVIRPLSGSGSTAVLRELIQTYGADSRIARCGCVMVGASETTFYMAAVYFSTVKERKLRYAIPVCLIASLAGAVAACALVR